MCVIYFAKNKATLRARAHLPEAASRNADGVGAMWLQHGQIHVTRRLRSSDYEQVLAEIPDDVSFGLHFRYGTSGGVTLDNVHPFLLHGGQVCLMHNGVVSGMGGNGRSDTREVCEDILSHIPANEIGSSRALGTLFKGSRVLMLAPNAQGQLLYYRLGTWAEETGGEWTEGKCEFAASASVKPYTTSPGSYWDGPQSSMHFSGGGGFHSSSGKPHTHPGVTLNAPPLEHPGYANYLQWRDHKQAFTVHWQAYLCRGMRQATFAEWYNSIGHGLTLDLAHDYIDAGLKDPARAPTFNDLPPVPLTQGAPTLTLKPVKPVKKPKLTPAQEIETALASAPWRGRTLEWCKAKSTTWATIAGVIDGLDKQVQASVRAIERLTKELEAVEASLELDMDDDMPPLGPMTMTHDDVIPLCD